MADKKKKDFGNDLAFDNPAFAFLTQQPPSAPAPEPAPAIQQEQTKDKDLHREVNNQSATKSTVPEVKTSEPITTKEKSVHRSADNHPASNTRFTTGPKSESNVAGKLKLINPTSVSDAFNTLGDNNVAIRRKTCKLSKPNSYDDAVYTSTRFSIALNCALNDELIRIADENGISRNHLVNILLKHGIETLNSQNSILLKHGIETVDSQELEDN